METREQLERRLRGDTTVIAELAQNKKEETMSKTLMWLCGLLLSALIFVGGVIASGTGKASKDDLKTKAGITELAKVEKSVERLTEKFERHLDEQTKQNAAIMQLLTDIKVDLATVKTKVDAMERHTP